MSNLDIPRGISGAWRRVNLPLLGITAAFILLFCLLAVADLARLSAMIDQGFAISARIFGLYWQILLFATLAISIVLLFMPGSGVKLGGLERPEFTTFQWAAMIMTTLLAGGGVFWAAGEPIAHFISTPPYFAGSATDPQSLATIGLAQAYLHWGFLAWAILGSLTTVMLMHYHYDKGLPLAPRTLLYPVFGARAIHGWIGTTADACCVIAVVAGTVGPIGFLGLQLSYGLNALFGLPDSFATQSTLILLLVTIYTVSAITGLKRGIQFMSRWNLILAFGLLVFILLFGPTWAILSGFVGGLGTYLQNFAGMAFHRGDAGLFGEPGWLGWWTVFFWGWFLGYGPMMAIFVARVSRGRTNRQIILLLSIFAPLITNFWFTIIGGTGIALEQAAPGVISGPFEGFNLPAALLAITSNLPAGFLVSLLFLVLTMFFVATTSDSMSYVISTSMSDGEPSTPLRAFWGVAMGVMALILIATSTGGIDKLQSFIVITAVPVSLILLPSLWDAIRITRLLGQGRK